MFAFVGYVAVALGWTVIVFLLLASSLYILSLLITLFRSLAFLHYLHGERPWKTVMAKRYTHVHRGTSYVWVGSGHLQTSRPLQDMDEMAAYRNEETGEWWFRPRDEFEQETRFNYEGLAK